MHLKHRMNLLGTTGALWGVVSCISTFAEPPGFRRIEVTDTPHDVEFQPQMNDVGQIVFSCRLGGFDRESEEEIFLYSRGEVLRLTSDETQDRVADVNNSGLVVWSRCDGPQGKYGPTAEIAIWRDGAIEYVTDDKADDYGAKVNNVGDIVWYKYNYKGCQGSNRILQHYDGAITRPMTDGTHSDQSPQLADNGTMVWTRFDFCDNPWTSQLVMMEPDGRISELSAGPTPRAATISIDHRYIAWVNEDAVELWHDGTVSVITADGGAPFVNSRGDIAFLRWDNDRRLWDSWLYVGGEFRLIARSDQWEAVYDMNEYGDIVVQSCTAALDKSEIVLYHRLPDGDLNCDERIDFDDIDGFVAAITNRADYEQRYPDCDWWLADMTGNRSVDFDDIDGFVNCLVNGGCERK